MSKLRKIWHSLRKEGWQSLSEKIWEQGYCYGCGACVIVCPMNALDFNEKINKESTPILNGECKNYFSCEAVCPALNPRDLPLPLSEVWAAKSRDESVEGQDGGATTTILLTLLERNEIDGVVHTRITQGYEPMAQLSVNPQEIKQGRRSSYIFVPLASLIRRAVIEEGMRIAVVGTPCVISGLGNIQRYNPRIFGDKIKLTISLFCTEIFQKEEFRKIALIENHKSITKVEIRRKASFMHGEETWTLPNKALKSATRSGCNYCRALISPAADLGVGAVDSELDETTLVILTKTGQNALHTAQNSLILRHLGESFPKINRLIKKKRRQKFPYS